MTEHISNYYTLIKKEKTLKFDLEKVVWILLGNK